MFWHLHATYRCEEGSCLCRQTVEKSSRALPFQVLSFSPKQYECVAGCDIVPGDSWGTGWLWLRRALQLFPSWSDTHIDDNKRGGGALELNASVGRWVRQL